jgi:hypothetical protein
VDDEESGSTDDDHDTSGITLGTALTPSTIGIVA